MSASTTPEGLAVLLLGPAACALADRLALSGYRPLCAEGDSASWPGAETPITAVVLSPGLTAVLAPLRQWLGAVPLLLGIPSDDVDGRSLVLAGGADDFWLPGAPPSDLLTRLRLLLGVQQRSQPAEPCLQLADLRLEPGRRQVQRGSRSVALTSREYQLLLLLLREAGSVLSRERILAEIWPEQRGASSNVIEVYVRYLRQKLEEGGERRLIHTVRGRGYCLSERLPPLEDLR
jgi:DNA-binding response OmpR family regulator